MMMYNEVYKLWVFLKPMFQARTDFLVKDQTIRKQIMQGLETFVLKEAPAGDIDKAETVIRKRFWYIYYMCTEQEEGEHESYPVEDAEFEESEFDDIIRSAFREIYKKGKLVKS